MNAKYFGTVRDKTGQALPGKSITVYDSTGAVATIYDALGAAISNPVTSRGDGYYEFYAPTGVYSLLVDVLVIRDVPVAQPFAQAGRNAFNVLTVAGDVVEAETVTIGADVFEIEIVNTDSTDTTLGGSFNQATAAITILKASYTHLPTTVGSLIRVENEILRLTAATSTALTFSRGASGTTAAAHANATAIYKGDGIVAGNAVGLVTTLTAAAFIAAFVADYNALTTQAVTAVAIDAATVLIKSNLAAALTLATTETLSAVGSVWNKANMYGGAAEAFTKFSMQQRVPLTQEVTLGIMLFVFPFTPATVKVLISATATPGKAYLWDGAVAISGGVVTIDNTGSVDWATTSTVTVLAQN